MSANNSAIDHNMFKLKQSLDNLRQPIDEGTIMHLFSLLKHRRVMCQNHAGNMNISDEEAINYVSRINEEIIELLAIYKKSE